MTTLTVRTREQTELVDLSSQLQTIVVKSGVSEGICHVFVPHTTAGVTLNEDADPDVAHDLLGAFDRLLPQGIRFRHAEGNSPAHVKAALAGSSVTVPIDQGQLALGRWQGVYFWEFDGPRTRNIHVTVLKA